MKPVTPELAPKDRYLICTDLDRTLLPNGPQAESSGAREAFARLIARPEFALAFVSGRRKALQESAISQYGLPQPDYAIADVGTTMYRVTAQGWESLPEWHEHIAASWQGRTGQDLAELVSDVPGLTLQEPNAQSAFKLSYFARADCDDRQLLVAVRECLDNHDIDANLIWSVDETEPIGLLDILPGRASKRHAIEFLIKLAGFNTDRVIFAGDSGNDLEVFLSGLRSVLVANATPEFRSEVSKSIGRRDKMGRLYVAKGGFMGMNGNYSAGILEGIAHFLPETLKWM